MAERIKSSTELGTGKAREEAPKSRRWSAIRHQFDTYKSKLLADMGQEGREEIIDALDQQDISAKAIQGILKKESPSKAERAKVEALADELRDRYLDIGQAKSHLRMRGARAGAESSASKKTPKKRSSKKTSSKSKRVTKAKPGRRKVAEGKTAGMKWWINRVPSAWDSAGNVTEFCLEPKIEMARRPSGVTELKHRRRGAGKLVPPEDMSEGEEICLVWSKEDPELCIKYGNVPKVFTNELLMMRSPRKKSIDGVEDLQALHPLLSKQMVSSGVEPDQFIPKRWSSIAQDGARPGFLPDDGFTDYRRSKGLAGITWEEQRAHDLGIKIRRVINKAKLWYEEHGLKATARKTRAGARKKKAEEHSGRSFRAVGESTQRPFGVKRSEGRVPRELRVLREQRRQKELADQKRRKKMGIKGLSSTQRAIKEADAETERMRRQRRKVDEIRKARGLDPVEPNPRQRLTKKQREGLLAKDFALSKKRMYPVHTIRWSRQSANDAVQDFDKGKITKSECKRVLKKSNDQLELLIDEAVGRYVNPGGPTENPSPSFLKRIRKDPSAAPKEQARASVDRYMQLRKRFHMSARQGRPRWDYLMEAYDAVENARSNFHLAGMNQDARSAQGQKKATHEMLLAFLEQGETGEVIVSGPTSIHTGWWYDLGLKEEPKSYAAVKRAYRRMLPKVHPDQGGSEKKFRRLEAARTCAAAYLGGPMQDSELTSNPSKSEHKRLGAQYLKKSQAHWDKYFKGRSKVDLLGAYKWLVLAEQELKFAGDKANLKEAQAGLRAATAEMKDRLD
jgi:hypothetical protein